MGAEAFDAMSEDDLATEKVMRSMRGMEGAPGMDVYDRDDISEMAGLGDDELEHESPRRTTAKRGSKGFLGYIAQKAESLWGSVKSLFG